VTVSASEITHNRARGGEGGDGGADSLGVGGGLDLTPGRAAYADALTVLFGSHASTSDDDVLGDLKVG
jgi:hypothetical protein